MSAPSGRAIVVVGAHGGCGASLVASALALAWVRGGSPAWLIDLDAERGDIGGAWGVAGERTLDALAGVGAELEPTHVDHAADAHASGVRIVAASGAPGAAAPWSPEAVRRLLDAAVAAVGPGGRVVVDAGTGPTRAAVAACAAAGAVVLTAGASVAAVRRAARLLDALDGVAGREVVRLVVVAGPAGRDMSPRAVARAVGLPLTAEVPWRDREARALACGVWPAGRPRLARAVAAVAEGLA